MKALIMDSYRHLVYSDVTEPTIKNGNDVLIRIRAAAICGSDVHGFDGSTGRRKPPLIMGHEGSGDVVSVGNSVAAFRPGDRVTFDSTIYCGDCAPCRRCDVNLCDNRKVLGVSCDEYRCDGIFAEYAVVPDRIVYRIPARLPYEQAALTEPAAVAAHAVRRTPLSLDDSVAVVGTGIIGLLIIKILAISGSGRILAFETDPSRHDAALRAGADQVFDPREPDVIERVRAFTDGKMLDRVFEAVGATAPIHTALQLVRKGGTVTLVGNVSPSVDIPLQNIVTRQISLLGSCAIAGEYPLVIDMMARGKLDVTPLISVKAPLSEGQQWFDRLYAREPGLLKVVLEP
jgi:(R,R)-butanediol dehydrogenase/meso-butanediol dehydrogenase/diacetyl reductase/L-iditol 2-dehydrogenase